MRLRAELCYSASHWRLTGILAFGKTDHTPHSLALTILDFRKRPRQSFPFCLLHECQKGKRPFHFHVKGRTKGKEIQGFSAPVLDFSDHQAICSSVSHMTIFKICSEL
jgi:hypothetical protein